MRSVIEIHLTDEGASFSVSGDDPIAMALAETMVRRAIDSLARAEALLAQRNSDEAWEVASATIETIRRNATNG